MPELNILGRVRNSMGGVSVSCDREIVALSGSDWQSKIEDLKQSIIVIDEDSEYIRSKEFAQCVKESDNYFLLITRNYLPQLPYSVDEIYKLEGGKNKRFVNVYKAIDKLKPYYLKSEVVQKVRENCPGMKI